MDYIYLAAAAIGGGWTGYLIGQFSGVKETNRRLSILADERDEYKAGVDHWLAEVDRQADVIAQYQRKQPARAPDGKFASKRERVTAELAAYVAERKAA